MLDKIRPVVVSRAGTQRAVGGSVADLNMPSTVALPLMAARHPTIPSWDSSSPGVGARLRPPRWSPYL